jgi:hypothetical protein
LNAPRWETDDEYREAAEFWRRELGRLVDGVSIGDHLDVCRGVMVDFAIEPPTMRVFPA